MIAELILVSTTAFQVTSYRSVPEQTDSTPYITSIGLRVRKGFCAVSQDVLKKSVEYGDVLYVDIPEKPELSRYCFVADTMNKRIKRGVDFWVPTVADERAVNVRKGFIYKLVRPSKTLNKASTSYRDLYVFNRSKSLLPTFNKPINKLLKTFNQLLTVLKRSF